jgi:hypothetical protein
MWAAHKCVSLTVTVSHSVWRSGFILSLWCDRRETVMEQPPTQYSLGSQLDGLFIVSLEMWSLPDWAWICWPAVTNCLSWNYFKSQRKKKNLWSWAHNHLQEIPLFGLFDQCCLFRVLVSVLALSWAYWGLNSGSHACYHFSHPSNLVLSFCLIFSLM